MTDKELAEMWEKRAEQIIMRFDAMSSKYHATMAAVHSAHATISFLKAKYSIPDEDVEQQPFATWYDRYTTEKQRADEMLVALRRAVLALAFAAETSPAMRDDYEAVSAAIQKATAG